MIGVHGGYLAAVVTRLVRMLFIHIIWYANLGEDARVNAHILCALLLNRCELVCKAIPDRCFSYFYGECWSEIFASQNAENINIPDTIPI